MLERAQVLAPGAIGGNPGLIITALPAAARFSVRCAPEARVALGDALGVVLPAAVCRAAHAGDRTALWLGPDEWLVIGPAGAAAPDTAGMVCSVVDISHRQTGFALSGPRVAEAISGYCPLDLALAAFPIGMCTRTILGKAEIVLWRTAPAAFHIEVWRSFAPYVVGCLEEARLEYLA